MRTGALDQFGQSHRQRKAAPLASALVSFAERAMYLPRLSYQGASASDNENLNVTVRARGGARQARYSRSTLP